MFDYSYIMKTLFSTSITIIFVLLTVQNNVLFSQEKHYYSLDTAQSRLFWKCDKHNGYIKYKSGHIEMLKDTLYSGEIVADMNSIKDLDIDYDLMQQTLENILKSSEFFETKKYPEAFFVTDRIDRTAPGKYHISGDMTVRGGDVCASFDAVLKDEESGIIHIRSEKFRVDRTKFGILIYSKRFPSEEKNPQKFEVPDDMILSVDLYFNKSGKGLP